HALPPPLSPAPAATATRLPGGYRVVTASATACPALSMRSMPATPDAMVRRSASAISALVRSSIIATDSKDGGMRRQHRQDPGGSRGFQGVRARDGAALDAFSCRAPNN